MTLPRVRFTVRSMMVAVAIVSVFLAGAMPVHRTLFCLREAGRYAKLQKGYLAEIRQAEWAYSKLGIDLREIDRWPSPECGTGSLASFRQGLEFTTRSHQTFLRAAFRPWEPIPEDPCAPEVIDPKSLQRLPRQTPRNPSHAPHESP